MTATTARGDHPVTPAEAVALSGGLLRYAESHPNVADHPLFVILARLLASVPRDQDVNTLQTATIAALRRENEDLQGLLSSARGEVEILKRDVVTEDARKAAEEAQKALQKAIADRDEAYQGFLDLEKQLKIAQGERDGALEAVRKTADDAKRLLAEKDRLLEDLNFRVNDQEGRLEKVIAKKDQANAYLEDLRGRVREAQKVIEGFEWSGKRRMHRDRYGPAKCCPICGRLSTEYEHRESGHASTCLFRTLTAALKPSK